MTTPTPRWNPWKIAGFVAVNAIRIVVYGSGVLILILLTTISGDPPKNRWKEEYEKELRRIEEKHRKEQREKDSLELQKMLDDDDNFKQEKDIEQIWRETENRLNYH